MRSLRKFSAMLLCAVMLVGLIPASVTSVFAADETIYVLAGGDFQEAGDHANSAANVTNILAQVSQKYTTMDGFLFIGDYDCETHDSASETAAGITALMGAVQDKYSNLNDDNSVLVQGNHDYMDSRIDHTGGHDFDGYSVFVLNEDDYPNAGGSESQIKSLATQLETWLTAKIASGYNKPIFVASHLPLAFTPRTVTQGDAKYAKYLFDVLNAGGKAGLNIIFLHGHDHAYGPDNYMGGEAIYLKKGDRINIAKTGSTSQWTSNTLHFTYMNAGYTGYYSDPFEYVTTAGTDKLTMTVFAISDDEVTVERYSANGQYNLKSAGYDGSYSNTSVKASTLGLTFNSSVYASPQTIELTTPVRYTATDAASGVTVTSKYTEAELGLSVTTGVTVPALTDADTYAGYEAFTIGITADISGDFVTITLAIPTDYPLDHTIVYQVNSDGSLTKIEAEITTVAGQKVAKFVATELGTYAVADKNETDEPETVTEYVRVENVSDLESGEQYLIVFDVSDQDATDRFVVPEITQNSSGTRIGFACVASAGITDNATIAGSSLYDDYAFTLEASGNGWKVKAPDGQYAYMYSASSRGAIGLNSTGHVFSIGYEAPDNSATSTDGDYNSYSFYVRDITAEYTTYTWDYNTSAELIYADGRSSDTYESRFVFYKKTVTMVVPEEPETAPDGTNSWFYLSDFAPMEEVTTGWDQTDFLAINGGLGDDIPDLYLCTEKETSADDAVKFTKGMSIQAPGKITYDISNLNATRFTCLYGTNAKHASGKGTVGLKIYTDLNAPGEYLYCLNSAEDAARLGVESFPIGQLDKAVTVDIAIPEGATRLYLEPTDGGNGADSDHAVFAKPKLYADFVYLSNMEHTEISTGWGDPLYDTAFDGPIILNTMYKGKANGVTRMMPVTCTEGVTIHAPSSVTYNIEGMEVSRFTAFCGISTNSGDYNPTTTFKVFFDGVEVHSVDKTRNNANIAIGENIDLEVPEGTKAITLTAQAVGSNDGNHTCWAYPRLFGDNLDRSKVADIYENGQLVASYTSVNEAVAAYTGGVIRLRMDSDETIHLTGDVTVDLAGNNLSNVTVSEGATLTLIDSATDDYKGEYGSATVSGTVAGGENYWVVSENGVYSAHRYDVAITHISLKPDADALGYKAQLKSDAVVQSHVESFGFNLWVSENNVKTYGKSGVDVVTLRLKGILAAGGGEMPIYAEAFVNFTNGETRKSDMYSTTMRNAIETIEANLEANAAAYTAAQITAIQEMIAKFENKLAGWNIDTLKAWTPAQ